MTKCDRSYGTDSALKMHLRTKHQEYYSTIKDSLSRKTKQNKLDKINEMEEIISNDSGTGSSSSNSHNEDSKMYRFEKDNKIFSYEKEPSMSPPSPLIQSGEILNTLMVSKISNEIGQPQLLYIYKDPFYHRFFNQYKKGFLFAPCLEIQIGEWTKKSYTNGDLIAVFDYENRTIAWEIDSKFKLEMRFDSIVDISIDPYCESRVYLIITFSVPPLYYKSSRVSLNGVLWERDYNYNMGPPLVPHVLNFKNALLNGPLDRLLLEERGLFKIIEEKKIFPIYRV